MCVFVSMDMDTYLAFPRIDVENVLDRVAAAWMCVYCVQFFSGAGTPHHTHTHIHAADDG